MAHDESSRVSLLVLIFFLCVTAPYFANHLYKHFGRSGKMEAEEKKQYSAVLIVLASNNAPFYMFCRNAWLAVADTSEKYGVRIILLYGKGGLGDEVRTQYDLELPNFVDSTELWGGAQDNTHLVNKTLFALDIIKNLFAFDYVVRTNIHTFWDAKNLVERLKALPKTNCFSGIRYDWGFPNNGVFSFIVGYSMIFSSDLIEPILKVSRENIQSYKEFNEDVALSVIIHGLIEVPILDTWYGQPEGYGPLIWFFGPGTEDMEPSNTPSSIQERIFEMIALGADHMRFKPKEKENPLAYYAVKVFFQLVYDVCIQEPSTDACTLPLSQSQVVDFMSRVNSFDTSLAVLRPPGSNTLGHGAPGH